MVTNLQTPATEQIKHVKCDHCDDSCRQFDPTGWFKNKTILFDCSPA